MDGQDHRDRAEAHQEALAAPFPRRFEGGDHGRGAQHQGRVEAERIGRRAAEAGQRQQARADAAQDRPHVVARAERAEAAGQQQAAGLAMAQPTPEPAVDRPGDAIGQGQAGQAADQEAQGRDGGGDQQQGRTHRSGDDPRPQQQGPGEHRQPKAHPHQGVAADLVFTRLAAEGPDVEGLASRNAHFGPSRVRHRFAHGMLTRDRPFGAALGL